MAVWGSGWRKLGRIVAGRFVSLLTANKDGTEPLLDVVLGPAITATPSAELSVDGRIVMVLDVPGVGVTGPAGPTGNTGPGGNTGPTGPGAPSATVAAFTLPAPGASVTASCSFSQAGALGAGMILGSPAVGSLRVLAVTGSTITLGLDADVTGAAWYASGVNAGDATPAGAVWTLEGPRGVNGSGLIGHSSSAHTLAGAGTYNFLLASTGANVTPQAWSVGSRLVAISTSSPTSQIEGPASSYTWPGLQINADRVSGPTGPFSDWVIVAVGRPGADGATGPTGPRGPGTSWAGNVGTLAQCAANGLLAAAIAGIVDAVNPAVGFAIHAAGEAGEALNITVVASGAGANQANRGATTADTWGAIVDAINAANMASPGTSPWKAIAGSPLAPWIPGSTLAVLVYRSSAAAPTNGDRLWASDATAANVALFSGSYYDIGTATAPIATTSGAGTSAFGIGYDVATIPANLTVLGYAQGQQATWNAITGAWVRPPQRVVFNWKGNDAAINIGAQTITLPSTPIDDDSTQPSIRGLHYYLPIDFTRVGNVLHWTQTRESIAIETDDYGAVIYFV